MGELMKKGYDIEIENIVIHHIKKEAHKDFTKLKCADKLLPKSDKEKFFIADVKKSFSGPGKTYGIFEEKNKSTIFQNLFIEYNSNDIDFLEFTIELMKFYEKKLQSKPTSSGGYLVFAEYKNIINKCKYLLVLAINNKQGYMFNEDLTLSEIDSIDLSKIDVASLINISQWNKFNEGDVSIDTYLSFRSGLKELSQYFIEFIGCSNKTSKKVGTKKLMIAAEDFLESKGLDKNTKDRFLEEIKQFCITSDKNNKGVKLSDLSRILNEDDPYEFACFASSEQYQVNEVISIDRSVIKYLTRTKFQSKSNDLLIEFENNLIGNKIELIEKNNSIIIKDLPQDLVNHLKEHL